MMPNTSRGLRTVACCALLCGCAEAAGDDDGGAAVTSIATTTTASSTSPSGGGDSGSDDAAEAGDAATGDPTADPTMDPPPTSDGDPTSSDGGEASSSGGSSGFSVMGNASRAAAGGISPGDDGVGTLYVGALLACDQNAASAGGATVLGADMSLVGAPVPFRIDGLPSGTYYIAGFLDDDVNADPNDPIADMGDLAFAEGFGIGCVEVVVAEADASGADFQLNINVPF